MSDLDHDIVIHDRFTRLSFAILRVTAVPRNVDTRVPPAPQSPAAAESVIDPILAMSSGLCDRSWEGVRLREMEQCTVGPLLSY